MNKDSKFYKLATSLKYKDAPIETISRQSLSYESLNSISPDNSEDDFAVIDRLIGESERPVYADPENSRAMQKASLADKTLIVE